MSKSRKSTLDDTKGGLFTPPAPFQRAPGMSDVITFRVDQEKQARSQVRGIAKKLGHTMTRFTHPVGEQYPRTYCRKCDLKIYRALNLEFIGPALSHFCNRPSNG